MAEHPLRERLRAQLMLALYRSGRQADALDAYQAGRTLLLDELGLEPGEELRELQRQILAHDAALELPERLSSLEVEHAVAQPELPAVRRREGRKTVTVLTCDLTASGSELDPESLRRLTARGFDELLPVLEGLGATVERSMGGAVTAIFGIPVVHEDDALRAARAAVEMRDRLETSTDDLVAQWGSALELRVGIGTGEVLVDAGGERPLATGQPVQSAMRLQQAASPGELLVDERTLRLVRASAEVETRRDHGRLVGVRPLELDAGRRFDSPMVGREREKRRLHDAFEQALGDRSCQLFTIIGAPGVGKSRLVREFVGDVSDDALVARGRCLPYGEGITYWPVREAVRDAAGLDDAASADKNLARAGGASGRRRDAALVAQRLGEVVGLSDRLSSAEETFWAVRTFVETLARRQPLVVVFDDIHWGEPTFLDLVDHVTDWTNDAPVLIVCVARPELFDVREQWAGGKPNATSVRLEPLSDVESATLLDNLAGPDLEEAARQRVVETAGGNPLFVEEMLALLLEDDREPETFQVPSTIQALLAARLDRLPDDERAAIEAAAVEGRVFHEGSVAELSGAEPADTHHALLGLARRDLIRNDKPVFSGERAFGFRHLLIRDAAYDSIPKENGRDCTSAMRPGSKNLGERPRARRNHRLPLRAGVPVPRGARTLRRPYGRRRSCGCGTAGNRRAPRVHAERRPSRRQPHLSRSCAALPDDPFRVELLPNMRVIQGLADLSWADRVLTEAVEAAATSGHRGLAAHALVQRGFLRLFFAGSSVSPAELFDVSERAIEVFEELGDDLGLARAWRLVAQANYLDRRAAACADASERALVHARRARDYFEEREIVEWLVIALLLGPAPADKALERCTLLLGREWDEFWLPSEISSAAAALLAMQGRAGEAEALVDRSRRAMEDAQEWSWIYKLLALVRAGFAWRSGGSRSRAASRIRRPQTHRRDESLLVYRSWTFERRIHARPV